MPRPASADTALSGLHLLARIEHVRGALTAQELRVAEAMADDAELIYRSITEFSAERGLGYGSVVRTCQKLGYAGFHDLKIHRAGEAERAPAAAPPPRGGIGQDAEQALADVRTAAAHLSEEAVAAAARALARARQVVAIGCAGSAPLAQDIDYRLARLGIPSAAIADAHMQSIRAASLRQGDALVAVSFSGATKEILGAVELAKRQRATVIALTNSAASPLASRCDIALLTGLRIDPRRAEVASKVAVAFCLDVLFARLAPLAPDALALARTTEAVAGNLL
jgi:RpiR family carbohydrate utilization transcriptional regulator